MSPERSDEIQLAQLQAQLQFRSKNWQFFSLSLFDPTQIPLFGCFLRRTPDTAKPPGTVAGP